MDSEDKFFVKESGLQSLSSSVQSTPEKNGHSDDASRSPELIQGCPKPAVKRELLRTCFDNDKLKLASKCKMAELKPCNRIPKSQEPRKASSSINNQPSSRKQQRKGENPSRLPPASEQSAGLGSSHAWICKNSACRAVLSADDTFCKRCSCCICHLFDDNKDPSLWLVCSDSDQKYSCGMSCHIECALQREKVGVVNLGQLMQLDGSYCCSSCGKVSGILGCWKKQLGIAKDARRVDAFCYRISLAYRLLNGTSRFKDLHEIVTDAKSKLETEVGPVDGVPAKMARGIVSRLSISRDVQKLCLLAIGKADEWLASASTATGDCREDSLPAACKFLFEEVTSSSVSIVIIELSNVSTKDIKGYKLWYCKSREGKHQTEPACVFTKAQRRILVSNLQPCTEYTFRIMSYTEDGDLGHSEAKCFTKSVEIIHKNTNSAVLVNHKKEDSPIKGSSSSKMTMPSNGGSPGFRVRDLGKILHLTWAQEQGCLEGFCSADIEMCCGISKTVKAEIVEDQVPCGLNGLDLNVVSVPDLNEEVTPPLDFSRDEDNGCTLEQSVKAADDAVASHENKKNNLGLSHGSGDSQTWTDGEGRKIVPGHSQAELSRKRTLSTSEEMHDCDSTLINASPLRISDGSGSLDENFEYCVKIIRWLECEGHIKQEFRLKLLTWFSLRSTEQERRVVNTFIQTLIDDPCSLAGQLMDSFSDIVSSKKPRTGFCSKLWH